MEKRRHPLLFALPAGTVMQAPMQPMMAPLGSPFPMMGGAPQGMAHIAHMAPRGTVQGQPVPQMLTATVGASAFTGGAYSPAYPLAQGMPYPSAAAPQQQSPGAAGAGPSSAAAATAAASSSSASSGGAAAAYPLADLSLGELLDRLGLSVYLPDLHSLGVKTVAELANLTESMLDRTPMKPAERAKLLASRPPPAAGGAGGSGAGGSS